MVHRQRGPDLPDLLVRLLRADQVVHAEHYRQNVAQALALDLHGGPEARVEGGGDPCGAEVGARIQLRKRFGAFEADELAEVAGDVEVEQRDEDCLPDGELGREQRGYAPEQRWAVAVASA